MVFKNGKVYDILKWIALVGCYALNYLWVELAGIWGFPYATEIGKTISVIGVFIGILIGVSGMKYKWINNVLPVEIVEDDTEADAESEG